MVSMALLAHKAKQFDDGLYAAVELAAGKGAGHLTGKEVLLAGLATQLAGGPAEPAVVTVLAASALGTAGTRRLPEPMAGAVAEAIARFEDDVDASKPLGFYTWSEDLARVFRRDRLLQQELKGERGIAAVAGALREQAELRTAYSAHLELAARLTNALVPELPDLRRLLASPVQATPPGGVCFFPPSRAHETDLVMRLYGDSPIPDGFSLADEMLQRIRAGTIDLTPSAASGWYDWQSWALETLAAPDRAPEARKLSLSDRYRAWLADLFRALLALTRETHKLVVPRPGAAAPRREIKIAPELRVEPVPTFYLRRALGYRFVRGVLEGAFGARALSGMKRLRANGPVEARLADELQEIEELFLGAYAASSADLGLSPDGDAKAAASLPAFLGWRHRITEDPDLSTDARMMVPLFYDLGRRQTKVLAFLGWTERPISAAFATPPAVEVSDTDMQVGFTRQYARLSYPVTAEVYVSKLLDRGEMRALCDAKKTRRSLVDALGS
jgi:hypothetical protein